MVWGPSGALATAEEHTGPFPHARVRGAVRQTCTRHHDTVVVEAAETEADLTDGPHVHQRMAARQRDSQLGGRPPMKVAIGDTVRRR